MVLVKKWTFFDLFFVGRIGQKNVFYDILKQKNAFLSNKNKKFKGAKNWHFSKGVNPWFWSKMAIFPSFFLGKIGQENVFYDILEQKSAFLSNKNKKFKGSKNWDFSKGVSPWFWSKIGNVFHCFILGKMDQENVFYHSIERKNASLGYKNRKLKKSKNWDFSKGVSPWVWWKIGNFPIFLFWGKYSMKKCFTKEKTRF